MQVLLKHLKQQHPQICKLVILDSSFYFRLKLSQRVLYCLPRCRQFVYRISLCIYREGWQRDVNLYQIPCMRECVRFARRRLKTCRRSSILYQYSCNILCVLTAPSFLSLCFHCSLTYRHFWLLLYVMQIFEIFSTFCFVQTIPISIKSTQMQA